MTQSIQITDVGRSAALNAQGNGFGPVVITEIVVGDVGWSPDGTATALQNQVESFTTMGGVAAAPDILHLTSIDARDNVTYTVKEYGFKLADGTLFAIYSHPTEIVAIKGVAEFGLAVDIKLTSELAGLVTVGPTNFSNPPATETTAGVLEIIDAIEVESDTDDTRALTIKKLVDRGITTVQRGLIRLTSNTDALAGLLTDRAISPANLLYVFNQKIKAATENIAGLIATASSSDMSSGTSTNKAVTPAGLADSYVTNSTTNDDKLGLAASVGKSLRDSLTSLTNAFNTHSSTTNAHNITVLGIGAVAATTYNLLVNAFNAHTNNANPHSQSASISALNGHAGTASSTVVAGHQENATQAETNAGSANKTVTPATLRSGFNVSLGTNGHIFLPTWMSGWGFQWGRHNLGGGAVVQTVYYSTPFPTACRGVFVQNYENGASAEAPNTHRVLTYTKSNFSFGSWTSNRFTEAFYCAVGY